MEGWLERLQAERQELDDRLVKLWSFIRSKSYNDLDGLNRALLMEQYITMLKLDIILKQRLSLAGY